MDKPVDKQAERILDSLRFFFPKDEMHRLLDDLVAQRLPCAQFKTFVWHTMAKTVAEQVADRKWELIDGDLRHKATQMAVIYTMHCVYERAAKGLPDVALAFEEAELWSWGSKAG